MGDGRLVVGKGGDGEGVAGAWVRADSRMVILGGDVGGGEEGGCVQKRPRNGTSGVMRNESPLPTDGALYIAWYLALYLS